MRTSKYVVGRGHVAIPTIIAVCVFAATYLVGLIMGSSAAAASSAAWGIVSGPATTGATELKGVSCLGTTFCAVVGDTASWAGDGVDTNYDTSTFGELWNGTTWLATPTANISNLQWQSLSSVSCSSTTHCFAVGSYVPSGANDSDAVHQTLIELWNGASWSVFASPNTAATDSNALASVSCVNASYCMAVGTVSTSVGMNTLAETWTGSSWSIVTTPNAQVPLGRGNFLTSVSCAAVTSCMAVGNIGWAGGLVQSADEPLLELWDGTTWSIEPYPQITPNASGGMATSTALLLGVSCPTTTFCAAVGTYMTTYPDPVANQTLVLTWNGSMWSRSASPNTDANDMDSLSAVSCTSATACSAVGSVDPYDSNAPPVLIESLIGSTWGIITSPGGAGTSRALDSISCTSAAACNAVGANTTASTPLIESTLQPPIFTSPAAASFTTGGANTFQVATSGGPTPVIAESGELPPGVTFHENGDGTATLAGQPQATGAFSISLTAHNGEGEDAMQSFTLTVQAPPLYCAVRCDVFGVGGDGQVYQKVWTGSAWTGWVLQGAPSVGLLGGLSVTQVNGRYDVFGVGGDGQVYQKVWTGSAWTGWVLQGAPSVGLLGGLSVTQVNGRYDVFGVGGDGQVYQKVWTGSAWTGWVLQGAPSVGLLGGLSVTQVNGRYDVFGVGGDGQVYQKVWTGSAWTGWVLQGAPSVGLLGGLSVTQVNGRYDVFGVGGDGQVYQKVWTGSAWTGWVLQGAPSVGLLGGLSVTQVNGRYDVFGVGGDGQVYQKVWTGSAWTVWTPQGAPSAGLRAGVAATE